MSKKRSIKVYGQSGYKYRETSTIILKGMWLKEASGRGAREELEPVYGRADDDGESGYQHLCEAACREDD